MFGDWQTSAEQYAQEVKLFGDEIGCLDRASIQDWMCEPYILKKTGLDVDEHQRRTIDSYKRLSDLAPEIPWMPVLQGYRLGEYLEHIEMYEKANVDLLSLPIVGIGSICRRQHTQEAESIIHRLASLGLRLHGFGFKLRGLERVAADLASADSMAWSFAARMEPPLAGHTHKNCANCAEYALGWYAKVMQRISNSCIRPRQAYLPI